jgi:hypothetical protein
MSFDFDGGVGSLEAAAVLAALAVFEEELAATRSVPAPRPVQGAWVMSGRPREVTSPFADEIDGLRRSPAPPT